MTETNFGLSENLVRTYTSLVKSSRDIEGKVIALKAKREMLTKQQEELKQRLGFNSLDEFKEAISIKQFTLSKQISEWQIKLKKVEEALNSRA